ncbi:hypothetical protein, partial [Streptococcus moroccensis]|uniref:hypothetical protein n=1 Tax=Streptococcus moroccensis TaxID=1451356 RepID=UPI0027D89B56
LSRLSRDNYLSIPPTSIPVNTFILNFLFFYLALSSGVLEMLVNQDVCYTFRVFLTHFLLAKELTSL